ncbi:IPT/TIG domain-containing protein [Muricauda sp. 2012CJ35-5]|uniref:IPT/TIG domain-containing protein n=1 Tax=Flagellimonas spongiicola TaxID=2942208 RepID=A0ABT0PT46_9FLAO|nr:IPT/TIG domain-containing protein [Allomuricauda spongiicola]MCL6274136.1 IPT/TIG domain-containing protein [Allomuricauda spongiicola]
MVKPPNTNFLLLLLVAAFACNKDDVDTFDGTVTTISSVQPTTGPIGEIVVLEGKGFGDFLEDNTIQFNGKKAEIITASTTRLVVTVPSGATTGPITLTVNGIKVSSATNFKVISENLKLSADNQKDDQN